MFQGRIEFATHFGQEIFDDSQDEIAENVLFVDFIDYNVCRVFEAGVRLKELQQNSSCAEQNRAFRPGDCTKIEEMQYCQPQ